MSLRLPARSALVAAALLLLPATAAEARTGPCVIGQSQPRCTIEYGKAPLGANDGDTIPVRIDGRSGYSRVRVVGVQAMELSDYVAKTGECRAGEATARVDRLLERGKGRVRLAERDVDSTSRSRPLRSVAVRVGKRWVDVGEHLMRPGLALWLNHNVEYQYNLRYAELSQRARRYQLGLFDPTGCGAGFQQGIPLQLWVNADPPGRDVDHLDQEYVTIRNNDAEQTLDLSGWWVRDGGLRRYTFAPGTLVAPGQTQTVRVGRGTDGPGEAWWGLRKGVFDNPSALDRGARGDGAFLFDPEGDIRASMIYPCRFECTDGLQGQLDVVVKPRGRQERITVTSRAAVPVSLHGYRLRFRNRTYAFSADDALQPGASLRVDVQGYPEDDRPGRKAWGEVVPILPDRGGSVAVQTFDDIDVACAAWGTGTCS